MIFKDALVLDDALSCSAFGTSVIRPVLLFQAPNSSGKAGSHYPATKQDY